VGGGLRFGCLWLALLAAAVLAAIIRFGVPVLQSAKLFAIARSIRTQRLGWAGATQYLPLTHCGILDLVKTWLGSCTRQRSTVNEGRVGRVLRDMLKGGAEVCKWGMFETARAHRPTMCSCPTCCRATRWLTDMAKRRNYNARTPRKRRVA
jgi:hypothetical protein